MPRYAVTVKTGTADDAGTDANVSLVTHSRSGAVHGPFKLDGAFEQGDTDELHFDAPELGDLDAITLRQDNSGRYPGWFVDFVRIERGDSKWLFPCYRWLASDTDDVAYRTLPVAPLPHTTYELQVTTGCPDGAGTDGRVFVRLHGKNGKTARMELDNHSDNFERGETDTFDLLAHELGELTALGVELFYAGPELYVPGDLSVYSPWYLHGITVLNRHTDHTTGFPCDRWFSWGEDDLALSRVLLPGHVPALAPCA